MRQRRRHRVAFGLGFAAGVGVLCAAFAVTSFPRGDSTLGLSATFTVMPTGELAMRRGALAANSDLRPGQVVRGARTVRNQTGRTLIVRLRALPSTKLVDSSMHVRLGVDGRPWIAGRLGGLRDRSSRWFQLRPGERRRIDFEARLVKGTDARFAGVIADVPLELRATPRYA